MQAACSWTWDVNNVGVLMFVLIMLMLSITENWLGVISCAGKFSQNTPQIRRKRTDIGNLT